ncbi:hypothetical protein KSS87_020696 [Heliosperma pusillum]|nr:hypothetical protein KSS87_020696 [Heliosperma pusillum]
MSTACLVKQHQLKAQALELFTEAIIHAFGAQYLRSPNANDLQRLLQIGAQRGFPGMMGSIDCMYWQLKNCQVGWRGCIKAVVVERLSFLKPLPHKTFGYGIHFFGIPGSCNDLTVLHRSPIFDDMMNGRAPRVNYMLVLEMTSKVESGHKLHTRMRLWEFPDEYVVEPTDGTGGSFLSVSRVDGSMKLLGLYSKQPF